MREDVGFCFFVSPTSTWHNEKTREARWYPQTLADAPDPLLRKILHFTSLHFFFTSLHRSPCRATDTGGAL